MVKKFNVAAYCRVSTDKDDQTNSLISQRKYFADYINHHDNWNLKNVYYDEGISGTQTQKRAGFNAMIEDAMQGEIDLILTKEVCRFARNTVDTLSFTRKLKEIGVGVIFTIDNIDTRDSDGELRLTIMASIAQEESRKTSERVKWGQKRRMEQGVVFGRDLLGYQVKDGRLSINEKEAAIVRAIFHKYTNEGKGTYVIARELAEEGMRPKRVQLWTNVTILRVLKSEKYVGDLCQKKTITPNYLTHKKKDNRGEEEMVYLRNHHEPIIERELWDRTQRELERRSLSQEENARYSNRYWCSGKIYCGECGQRYVSRSKALKNGEKYRGWRCHTAAVYGLPKQNAVGEWRGCQSLQVNHKMLLYCMKFCISHVQMNKEALKREILQEIQGLYGVADRMRDAERIEREIEKVKDKKKKAIDLVLEGVISSEELKKQNSWYEEEILSLEQQLQEAQKEAKIRGRQMNHMEQYGTALDEILDVEMAKEALYGEVLEKMVIYRDHRLDIWLKCLPVGFRLSIHTSGRGENFAVKVLDMQVIAQEEG